MLKEACAVPEVWKVVPEVRKLSLCVKRSCVPCVLDQPITQQHDVDMLQASVGSCLHRLDGCGQVQAAEAAVMSCTSVVNENPADLSQRGRFII